MNTNRMSSGNGMKWLIHCCESLPSIRLEWKMERSTIYIILPFSLIRCLTLISPSSSGSVVLSLHAVPQTVLGPAKERLF